MGLLVSTTLLVAASSADPAPRDAIALAVVFDTSGSMNQPIPTKPGSPPDSKVRIAQRAFGKVIDRLDAFVKAPGARPLLVGTYVFAGGEARTAHPLRPFNAAQLRHWLANLRPDGPTPLGAALFSAARDLLSAPAGSRHLLVLTDGANTMGPTPEKVLAQIAEACTRKEVPIFTHVIALDIKPEVFSALKRMGATLIGAIDETQLNSQFDFILEEKILVEAPR
jgi:hypothetical protein